MRSKQITEPNLRQGFGQMLRSPSALDTWELIGLKNDKEILSAMAPKTVNSWFRLTSDGPPTQPSTVQMRISGRFVVIRSWFANGPDCRVCQSRTMQIEMMSCWCGRPAPEVLFHNFRSLVVLFLQLRTHRHICTVLAHRASPWSTAPAQCPLPYPLRCVWLRPLAAQQP